jgi:DNA gyrase subunit A
MSTADVPPTTNTSKIPVSIQDEMRNSYLDYAMSVIIGRAIPDARDGLKPVHRRILYSAHIQGLVPTAPHKKSAKIVGDVLAQFHPHGDAPVYDAMVRLAQDFSMRYPLIDGQGNFGSVDGDPPAAYRYTEARLSRAAVDLLLDIEKDSVDFVPTFDDTNEEPRVLPTRIPNLLVNGSGGIAVGMATNVPPHNLREIIDATLHLLRNPKCAIEELMAHVQGPDFPTGAMIFGRSGIDQYQRTGRGSVIMRSPIEVEPQPGKSDREQLVITAIPYQANKAKIISKIDELRKEKKIEGIVEAREAVRDESDREANIRIVVELKKDVVPQVIINQLYRMTELQTSFGVINLAIVRGRPQVMDLKETLEVFVEHRREVVTRRTRWELRQAEAQRELVEGLGMATTEVDLVVKTIRQSRDTESARQALMRLPLQGLEAFVTRAGRPKEEIAAAKARGDYFLSERQAKAILEMRLSKLTGLEQEKLAAEYGELCTEIARLRDILANEHVLLDVIAAELAVIREKFGDERRTQILASGAEIEDEDLIQVEDMIVTVSHAGYIKRTSPTEYRAQKRGGKGLQGMSARDEDWVSQLFYASTHSFVFIFASTGKVYVKKVYEIPLAARNAKGRAIVNFVGMEPGEKVKAIVAVPKIEEGRYVVTLTKKGQIKKTALTEYENFRERGIIGVKVEEGDELLSAALTDGTSEVLIATKDGQSIRFPEEQVRPMGRATMGVKGVELSETDEVRGFTVTDPARTFVLAVCENGYGKRTQLEEFRLQKRGGKGIILIDTSDRNGPVVDIRLVKSGDELMLMTDRGQTIRTRIDEVRETGRNAQGVKLMTLAEGERLVAIEVLPEGEKEEEGSMLPPADGSVPPASLN